jgi:hypothetical protein
VTHEGVLAALVESSRGKGCTLVGHAFAGVGDDMSKPPTGGFNAARTPDHGVDS